MQEKRMRDDLISRQAAIDALSVGKELLSRVLDNIDVVGTDREKYSWGLELIKASIKDIEELPPAQTPHSGRRVYQAGYADGFEDGQLKRKRGKWIGYNTDKYGWKRTDGSPVFVSCSECFTTVLNNGSPHWNYCPNCGAKMEEVNDDEQ